MLQSLTHTAIAGIFKNLLSMSVRRTHVIATGPIQ
ncbi:MAG: hypothetical protein QOF41_1429 [Methylobacteriaceae bacterium]|nr:hypothetical protein [Methylobacteriaceae bacterium]